jgi:hypothetical protein
VIDKCLVPASSPRVLYEMPRCRANPSYRANPFAAGLAYAIIDLGIGAATGTTLTDRIATGVDNAIKN